MQKSHGAGCRSQQIRSMYPVSYTHLDVYKRQVAIFPMLAVYGYHAYNHYENDQSMYIHRPDPVSYTHLDVYKRQMMESMS